MIRLSTIQKFFDSRSRRRTQKTTLPTWQKTKQEVFSSSCSSSEEGGDTTLKHASLTPAPLYNLYNHYSTPSPIYNLCNNYNTPSPKHTTYKIQDQQQQQQWLTVNTTTLNFEGNTNTNNNAYTNNNEHTHRFVGNNITVWHDAYYIPSFNDNTQQHRRSYLPNTEPKIKYSVKQ